MNFDSNFGCAAIRKRRKDEERDEDQFAVRLGVGVFSFCRFDIGGSDDVIGRRSFIHTAASFVLVFSFSSYWFSVFFVFDHPPVFAFDCCRFAHLFRMHDLGNRLPFRPFALCFLVGSDRLGRRRCRCSAIDPLAE